MLKSTLVSIVAVDGHSERALLALAAGAAHGLEPRFGTAIVESAREAGVVGSTDGHTVVVGNAARFDDLGLPTASLGEWLERLRRRGQQVLVVSVDGRTAGFLGLTDAVCRC